MKIRAAVLISLVAVTSAFADDQTARVQQQLKDQGYYYGEVTGQKDADTTAAVRRFQIRNGLQINGELNDETLKAIANAATSSPPPNKSVAASTPQPQRDTREEQERYPEEEEAAPRSGETAPASPNVPQDRQVPPPVYPGRPAPAAGGYFARTPYETAPREVQQDLIERAQRKLAKRDLYRGAIDGVVSADLEFSLRAYQSRVGLQPTGRLDLETLAALELLPGANQPVFVRPRRAYPEPPVRGEWVRP